MKKIIALVIAALAIEAVASDLKMRVIYTDDSGTNVTTLTENYSSNETRRIMKANTNSTLLLQRLTNDVALSVREWRARRERQLGETTYATSISAQVEAELNQGP